MPLRLQAYRSTVHGTVGADMAGAVRGYRGLPYGDQNLRKRTHTNDN